MIWEYRVGTIAFEDLTNLEHYLNRFGADGWELVTVVPSVIPGYPPGKDNLRSAAMFKRQASKGPAISN
jgi:hypothetical protein